MKRFCALCCGILMLLLSCPLSYAAAATEADAGGPASASAETTQSPEAAQAAENLSRKCTYTLPAYRKYRSDLYNLRQRGSIFRFTGETTVTVAWDADVPVRQIYLEWFTPPAPYRVVQRGQDGTVLSDRDGDCVSLSILIPLEPGCASLSLISLEGYHLCNLVAYGAGPLPGWYRDWVPTYEKLDYLIVSAHPDDDQLFMGAVIPTYTGGLGLRGTVLYMTCRTRERYTEALNGLWETGLRNLPLFAFFPDGTPDEKTLWDFWDYDAVVLYLVRTLRTLRPELVVTHDLAGEYGQPLHKATAAAVCEAVRLSGDPSFDPESAAEPGVWTVKKLYLHLYEENRLTIDMRLPIAAYDGKTALEIAKAAYAQHKSQQYLWFSVDDQSVYSPAEYGLYASTVGLDSKHDSMFENIPEACLSNGAATTVP